MKRQESITVILEKESLEDEFQKIRTDLNSRSAEESRYQDMSLVVPHGIGQTRDGLHREQSNVIDSHEVASIMNGINETIKETEGLKEMLEVATKELKAAVQMIAQLNTKITQLENDLQQAKHHQAEFSYIIRENEKSISRLKHVAPLTNSVPGACHESVSCSGVPEHYITREKMQNAKSLDTLRDRVSSYDIKMGTSGSHKLHNQGDTYKKDVINLSNIPSCKEGPEGTTYFDPRAVNIVSNDDRMQNQRFFHQYQQLMCDTEMSSRSQATCITEDAQTTCTILVSAVNQEGDSRPEAPQPNLKKAKMQNQNHMRQCQQNLAIQQQALTDQISRQIALLKGEIGQNDPESASECLSRKDEQDAKHIGSTEDHNIAKPQAKCTDNNAIEGTLLLPEQSKLGSSVVDSNHNRSNVLNGKFRIGDSERDDSSLKSIEQIEANVGKPELDINKTIEHDGASLSDIPELCSLDNEVNTTMANRECPWEGGTDGSNKGDERNFPTSGANVRRDEGNFPTCSPDVASIAGHPDENQSDVLEGEIKRRQPVSENIDMSDKPKANRKRNAKFPRFNQASAKIRKNDVSEIFLELKCRASLLEHGLKNVINSDSETKRQNISHDVDKLLGDVAFLEGLLKNEGCNEVKLQLQKLNKIMMDACEEFHMLSSGKPLKL